MRRSSVLVRLLGLPLCGSTSACVMPLVACPSLLLQLQQVDRTSSWSSISNAGFSTSTGQAICCMQQFSPAVQAQHSISAAWDQSVRSLFAAAPKKALNAQIHKPDATKGRAPRPQPDYDWMVGRYIVDRNNIIWHKQAGYHHKRHKKGASRLTDLKRWNPLYKTYAAKFLKLGFKRRYWQDPEPLDVPGYQPKPGETRRKRWNGDVDMRRWVGDPALRPN